MEPKNVAEDSKIPEEKRLEGCEKLGELYREISEL
jgi:hypothetical protein